MNDTENQILLNPINENRNKNNKKRNQSVKNLLSKPRKNSIKTNSLTPLNLKIRSYSRGSIKPNLSQTTQYKKYKDFDMSFAERTHNLSSDKKYRILIRKPKKDIKKKSKKKPKIENSLILSKGICILFY